MSDWSPSSLKWDETNVKTRVRVPQGGVTLRGSFLEDSSVILFVKGYLGFPLS